MVLGMLLVMYHVPILQFDVELNDFDFHLISMFFVRLWWRYGFIIDYFTIAAFTSWVQ